jgi:hypothetical protein
LVRIKKNKIVGYILNYSFEDKYISEKKVPGYTKCPSCDQNKYDSQELEGFVERNL